MVGLYEFINRTGGGGVLCDYATVSASMTVW